MKLLGVREWQWLGRFAEALASVLRAQVFRENVDEALPHQIRHWVMPAENKVFIPYCQCTHVFRGNVDTVLPCVFRHQILSFVIGFQYQQLSWCIGCRMKRWWPYLTASSNFKCNFPFIFNLNVTWRSFLHLQKGGSDGSCSVFKILMEQDTWWIMSRTNFGSSSYFSVHDLF